MVAGAAATVNVMAPHKQRPVPNGLADISPTPRLRLARRHRSAAGIAQAPPKRKGHPPRISERRGSFLIGGPEPRRGDGGRGARPVSALIMPARKVRSAT